MMVAVMVVLMIMAVVGAKLQILGFLS